MRRAGELNLQVNIAIAANTGTAIYAARGLPGTIVIPPGNERKTLSTLPLDLLPASSDVQDTWKLWGLKSFGDLAALPETGVAERLGPEGARLHRIARGTESRPLIPFIPAIDFYASRELEHPVELLDPLSFILASLLNQLCASLEARALAISELHVEFKLENAPVDASGNPQIAQISQKSVKSADCKCERRLSFPVPLRDSTALLKLLRLDLESHPPQAPIIAVSLRATPAKPRVTQNSLFIPPAPEPQKLELTLARITKLVGQGNAGSPMLIDTHRPGAFEMRPFRIQQPHWRYKTSQVRKGTTSVVPNAANHAGASAPEVPSAAKADLSGQSYGMAKAIPLQKSRGLAGAERKSQRRKKRSSWLPSSPPVSFRVFRPPLGADVQCDHDQPAYIQARGIRGKVVSCAGPWRTSGDWWMSDPWQRDEWDVEIAPLSRKVRAATDGTPGQALSERLRPRSAKPHVVTPRAAQPPTALYRIYRDLKSGVWYVEGSYD
ncbi:MAG: hypothetical protein HYX72_06150 [Acidobacteria bacterium]|nr:hypothetical protein [Acidobacteriota bacterium]